MPVVSALEKLLDYLPFTQLSRWHPFPCYKTRTQSGEGQLQSSLKGGWHHWFCQDGSDAQPRYGIV